MTHPPDELWIGLVEVKALSGNVVLDGCTGAFSTFLAVCNDDESFKATVIAAAEELKLELVAIQWAEPYLKKFSTADFEEHVYKTAEAVRNDGISRFSVFHGWCE